MSTLFAFLAAAVGPLAVRILLALGVSVLTVSGVDTVVSQLVGYVTSNWSGMAGSVAGLVGLSGAGQALGLVLGAINARAALWAMTSMTRWVVKGA
jgi:hypothetical protein